MKEATRQKEIRHDMAMMKANPPIFFVPELSQEDIDAVGSSEVSKEAEDYLYISLDELHASIMEPVIERCKKALEATND